MTLARSFGMAATAALALMLGACQTSGTDSPTVTLNPLGSGLQRLPGRYIDKVANAPARPADAQSSLIDGLDPVQKAMAEATTVQDSLLLHRTYGQGIVRINVLDDRLNQILAKIQAAWPGAPIEARVFVTPENSFNASARPGGGIFIPIGLVEKLESEDEVAFIVAHEYAHLRLDHFKSSDLRTLINSGNAVASIVIGLTGKKSTEAEMLRRTVITQLAYESGNTLLMPAWDREHEEQADILGVDLLLKAGYSQQAPATVLALLQKFEAANAAKPVDTSEHGKAADAHFQQGKVGEAMSSAMKGMLIALSDEANRAVARMREGHDDAQSRDGFVATYIEREYADAPYPTLKTAEWRTVLESPDVKREREAVAAVTEILTALEKRDYSAATNLVKKASGWSAAAYIKHVHYTALDAAGRKKEAAAHLQSAIDDGDRPLVVAMDYVNSVEQNKGPAAALEALERARLEFKDPPKLLPMLIRYHVAKGNKTQASILSLRCATIGDPALSEQCQAASGKI